MISGCHPAGVWKAKNRSLSAPEEGFLVAAHFFAPHELIDLDVRREILKGQFWIDIEVENPPTRYLGLEGIRD